VARGLELVQREAQSDTECISTWPGTLDSDQYYQETYVNKMKELTTYSLVETERKSQGPHSGSYLEFTFGENPETIIETLREDLRLDDVHDDELRTVVNAQLNQ